MVLFSLHQKEKESIEVYQQAVLLFVQNGNHVHKRMRRRWRQLKCMALKWEASVEPGLELDYLTLFTRSIVIELFEDYY